MILIIKTSNRYLKAYTLLYRQFQAFRERSAQAVILLDSFLTKKVRGERERFAKS